MTDQEVTGDRHAALASDARRRVLELLMGSDSALDAAAVAARIDVHITTARFHLEQLEGAGLIRRAVERAGTRGRPRILFTAGPAAREGEARHDLSQALAAALAEDPDGGRARAIRAGERWSEAFAGEVSGRVGEGALPLVQILDRLGFDPAVEVSVMAVGGGDDGAGVGGLDRAGGDGADFDAGGAITAPVINLEACPFRADARTSPEVICSVHLGLIRGIVRELGHDPQGTTLLPFVGPELCQVRLRGSWPTAEGSAAE